MKLLTLLPLYASGALGHYFFPSTVYDGETSAEWEYIRETKNNPSSGPIEDVDSNLLRCYEKEGHDPADTLSVAAGSSIAFTSSNTMGHPGPVLWYMAAVPSGADVQNWDSSGQVWFKIDQYGDQGLEHPSFDTEMTQINTTIPSAVPDGDYLLRGEHIALHIAGSPQWYLSCAQITVTGGGSGSPSPLVAFPGAYSMDDPGLTADIYGGDGPYEYPGPAVWSG